MAKVHPFCQKAKEKQENPFGLSCFSLFIGDRLI